jgi:hypothetical protein
LGCLTAKAIAIKYSPWHNVSFGRFETEGRCQLTQQMSQLGQDAVEREGLVIKGLGLKNMSGLGLTWGFREWRSNAEITLWKYGIAIGFQK